MAAAGVGCSQIYLQLIVWMCITKETVMHLGPPGVIPTRGNLSNRGPLRVTGRESWVSDCLVCFFLFFFLRKLALKVGWWIKTVNESSSASFDVLWASNSSGVERQTGNEAGMLCRKSHLHQEKKTTTRGSTAFGLNGFNRRAWAGYRACIMESRGEGVAQRHLSTQDILCQQLL